MLQRILYCFVSFLLGGIPFGYLAGKLLKGIDIREHGSKNVGATNVLRVVGKGPGIAVYFLDAAKGLAPVLLAKWLFAGSAVSDQWFHIGVAVAAILGHIFTPYLRFKGGKGVATASGAMLALAPIPLLAALLVFIFVFVLSRYVSLGSLCAALVFPIAVAMEKILKGQDPFVPILAVGWLLCILVIVTHKANIVRLAQGTESRISFNAKPEKPH